MYLALILISLFTLYIINWEIALPVAIIVFCSDRIIDSYRRVLEDKINKSKLIS